jgi:hypothetical protein
MVGSIGAGTVQKIHNIEDILMQKASLPNKGQLQVLRAAASSSHGIPTADAG